MMRLWDSQITVAWDRLFPEGPTQKSLSQANITVYADMQTSTSTITNMMTSLCVILSNDYKY